MIKAGSANLKIRGSGIQTGKKTQTIPCHNPFKGSSMLWEQNLLTPTCDQRLPGRKAHHKYSSLRWVTSQSPTPPFEGQI
jgi:hypothetical protein